MPVFIASDITTFLIQVGLCMRTHRYSTHHLFPFSRRLLEAPFPYRQMTFTQTRSARMCVYPITRSPLILTAANCVLFPLISGTDIPRRSRHPARFILPLHLHVSAVRIPHLATQTVRMASRRRFAVVRRLAHARGDFGPLMRRHPRSFSVPCDRVVRGLQGTFGN